MGCCGEDDAPIPPHVIAEGWLHILHASKSVESAALTSSWKRRYFVLTETGMLNWYKKGKNGQGEFPMGGFFLSIDFFVGDSLGMQAAKAMACEEGTPAIVVSIKELRGGR